MAGGIRVLLWGMADHRRGTTPDTCSVLEVTIAVSHQGRGLSHRMVAALREAVGRQGFDTLVAPVRPSHKHLEPHVTMSEYAARVRADNLPEDPWMRVHARAGATIEKVAPTSMTVVGTPTQWQAWSGRSLDGVGAAEVPGALVPVHVDAVHGHVVYVEPNVWMRHIL